MSHPEEYRTMVAKIKQSKSDKDLKKIEALLDKVFNAGIFSVEEFKSLDNKIMDKYIQLERNDNDYK